MNLLLNPHTYSQLQSVVERRPHAVILIGPEGAGKLHISRHLSSQLLEVSPDKLSLHPYYREFLPEKESLGIDQIRDLQRFMQLKTTGQAGIRRIALLVDAHLMTIEAQNALLKVLEEPPADTIIILTAQGQRSLQATIYSRVQAVAIKPVSKNDVEQYFSNQSAAELDRSYLLSGGNAGTLHALLSGDDTHPLASAIATAKELLAGSTFDRLKRVDELSRDKQNLSRLISALKQVAQAAMAQTAKKGNRAASRRWSNIVRHCYEAEATLPYYPNSKLLLTNLFLGI